MKQLLRSGLLALFAFAMLLADQAEAQFFPHNDTTSVFVSTTNAFGRIQSYDGADGRYQDVEDKMIDRFYQLAGLNDNYVWNPNDDPDFNLVDTLYYEGPDSTEYFRELLMDNSFRADPPVEIGVHTLVRMFKDEKYGLARLGIVKDEDNDYLFSALLRAKIFEEFGGETLEWDEDLERLYIFNNNGAIGLQALTQNPVGVVLLDFEEYDSTDPLRDNARDFFRWDLMELETFPTAPVTVGPDGGWAYMNFGHASQFETGDTLYVWFAFTHGPDLDEVDDRLDEAVTKADELGIIGEPVSIGPGEGELPARIALEQNYPNPFNPGTTIRFELSEAAHTRLSVYDLTGRQVAVLLNEQRSAGTHTVQFNAESLSSGVYIYRLQSAGQTLTRSMTLIK